MHIFIGLKLTGLNNVVSALTDQGILIIGAKERLPDGVTEFESFELPYLLHRITCS
jgi:chemotaxis methyl-accepting protein methylase